MNNYQTLISEHVSNACNIRLIVGLGNPGKRYELTRHNVAYMFLQKLAYINKLTFHHESKFSGSIASFIHDHNTCLLLKPETYMNKSGDSVVKISKFYKILPDSILVVHDDLDFAQGIVKLKHGGGSGGHNGLRSIIDCLNSENFFRLRIGIGRPKKDQNMSNYVLEVLTKSDQNLISQAIDQGLEAVTMIIEGKMADAFNFCNRKLS